VACDIRYEEIGEFAAGELPAERARELEQHLRSCANCQRRLDAVRAVDTGLARLPRLLPSPGGLHRARRSLSEVLRRTQEPELMRLDEVAEFLRISLDELEEVVAELPAFEVAGQLRVRRAKLLEWVEARERSYRRSSAQSEVARAFADTIESH